MSQLLVNDVRKRQNSHTIEIIVIQQKQSNFRNDNHKSQTFSRSSFGYERGKKCQISKQLSAREQSFIGIMMINEIR